MARIQSGTMTFRRSASGIALPINAPSNDSALSISGTVAPGGYVSITALSGDFGDMGGDIIQFATGDEGTDGQGIDASTPTIGQTLSSFVIGGQRDEHLYYSRENPRPGRVGTLRRSQRSAVDGGFRAGGFGSGGRNDPEIFFSYWRRANYGQFVVADANHKDYYIFSNGTGPSGQNEVPQPILHVPAGTSSYAMGPNLSGAGDNVWNNQSWSLGPDSDLQWQRWDNWLVMSSGPGVEDGKFKVWRDGRLGLSRDAYLWQPANMQTPATGFKDIRIGYMNTNMPDAIIDYSDFYSATTQARVEIGNASTYSACTHLEIQPVREVNWSPQTLNDVLLNQGGFDSLAGKYIYVIKKDGTLFSESGVQI